MPYTAAHGTAEAGRGAVQADEAPPEGGFHPQAGGLHSDFRHRVPERHERLSAGPGYSRTRVIFFTSGSRRSARITRARCWRLATSHSRCVLVKTARSSAMVSESMFEPASAITMAEDRAVFTSM